MKCFNDIPGSNDWNIIKLIDKGWSDDKKYYIKKVDGRELLLRISDITQYENKKKEFESLKLLMSIDALMSRPIDFGICNNGKLVYSLLTWINGEDSEVILPKLGNKEQYFLGIKSGVFLKLIHEIPASQNQSDWTERFNRKIDMQIASYKACGIQFDGSDRMIKYIEDNRSLLTNRPQSF